MFAEEWPLMMFTLLSQLAVGTYFILVVVRSILNSKNNSPVADQITKGGMRAVGPLMALALIFSLFHLGSPLGAYRSISNLGSSWLSREIVTAGGFFVLWAIGYYLERKGKSGAALSWVTVLFGLAAVFSMASIYATSVRPAWADTNTYIAFFGTTLLFGATGALASMVHGMKGADVSPEVSSTLKKVSFVAIAALAVPLIYLPVYISGLGSGGSAAMASAELLKDSYAMTLILKWVISILGGVLLLNAIFKGGKGTIPANSVYLALGVVLVGEFIGRYVFYASAVSIMVGLH
ncbi:dimethyl sulfoxide reductase anchor subunit family protein [Desulfosporosinus youngiae]|uniref:DMSO reductase anchor subunit n=1 Tax=Desulfosporosinus youngiae DSM 17734 TaxID=768710 RepID=H5Y5Q9_9FIRM|nr:DmsC/YnfH family molybdoenzyme membrane anchor subunit [Desulfosporosinus youngiae]EHQ90785.1 DMSO reductase anchor subunit [Desulfosporosinus youngiae DSM 17734]